MRLQTNDNSRLEAVSGRLVGALQSPLTLLDDHNDDLTAYTQTEGWAVDSSYVFEGSGSAHNAPSGQEDLIAMPGDLPADFAPGDVWFTTLYIANQSTNLLFGIQDVSPSNQYELRLLDGGGTELFADVNGTNNSLPTPPTGAKVYDGFNDRYLRSIVEWDPAKYADGTFDIDDSDGSHEGDFLVTVTTGDWVPLWQFFSDANDLTYTTGGFGFRALGNTESSADVHYLGARDSIPEYERLAEARPWQPNEIDHWQTTRFSRWSDDVGEFKLAKPTDHGLPASPGGHDHVLMNPAGTGFSKLAGTNLNLGIPEGVKAEMYFAASSTSGGKWMFGIEDNDFHRMEARFDSGDVRYNNAVTGNFGSQPVSWETFAWHRGVMDRTAPGDVTWELFDPSGTRLWTTTVPAGAAHSDVSMPAIWAPSNGNGQADLFATAFRQVA